MWRGAVDVTHSAICLVVFDGCGFVLRGLFVPIVIVAAFGVVSLRAGYRQGVVWV